MPAHERNDALSVGPVRPDIQGSLTVVLALEYSGRLDSVDSIDSACSHGDGDALSVQRDGDIWSLLVTVNFVLMIIITCGVTVTS